MTSERKRIKEAVRTINNLANQAEYVSKKQHSGLKREIARIGRELRSVEMLLVSVLCFNGAVAAAAQRSIEHEAETWLRRQLDTLDPKGGK